MAWTIAEAAPAPVILYTDITSGPNSGGENNNGAYLSVFGVNLGDYAAAGTTTRLYIDGAEVADYKYFGPAVAQPFDADMPLQQLSVQIGAVGNPTPGTPLPVMVKVRGAASNTDKTFTIQPGKLIYVATSGSQTTGDGSFSNPYRKVQDTSPADPAYGQLGPGDTIVMRGGTYPDTGLYNGSQYFFCRFNRSGTPPNGTAGNGPMTIVGYPGEHVVIQLGDVNYGGFVGGPSSHPEWGNYVTVANLHIDGGTRLVGDGPLNGQSAGDHWRVVNVEVYDWLAGSEARSGAYTGRSVDSKFFGNKFHNIQGGSLNHGMYFAGSSDNVEVAYNEIYDIALGNIIQLHDSDGWGNLSNFDIHHNRLHDGGRYGLNLATGAQSVRFYNNLVYNTALAGMRFSTTVGDGIDIYHNTLYNVCTDPAAPFYQAINNDSLGSGITVRNNIVHANGACTGYYSNTAQEGTLVLGNNLYAGLGVGAPGKDAAGVEADPLFVDPAGHDFDIHRNSPAVDAASASVPFSIPNDFSLTARPQLGAADIGAHEFLLGDINSDERIDSRDIGIMMNAWGSNDADADLNGDATVNAPDLAIVLEKL
jgi:hypothetical protein